MWTQSDLNPLMCAISQSSLAFSAADLYTLVAGEGHWVNGWPSTRTMRAPLTATQNTALALTAAQFGLLCLDGFSLWTALSLQMCTSSYSQGAAQAAGRRVTLYAYSYILSACASHKC